jgi:nucleoid-associated protein YgaU
MRTDAKIGFAIVGVLVMVLAVYGFVVGKHAKRPAGETATNGPVKVQPDATPPPPADAAVSVPPAPSDPEGTTPASNTGVKLVPAPGSSPATPGAGAAGNPLAMGGRSGPGSDLPPVDPVTPGTPAGSGPGTAVTPRDSRGRHPTPPGRATDRSSGPAVVMATHTYKIRSGQTLSSIAAEVYGDSRMWRQIVKDNPGLNPSKLKVGTRIQIPDPAAVRPNPAVVVPAADGIVSGEPSVAAVVAGSSYRVRPGDTLYAIAKRYLGSGRDAEKLYELNRDVIGPKMSLKLGTVLRLPTAADGLLSDAAN